MRKRMRLAQNQDDLHDLGSDDLLSRLSDDILVSIMSYLPLKDAAVTSKLSRRWRYVWCQRVCLDFEDKERSNKIGSEIYFDRIVTWRKYIDLVFAERNKYINWVNRIIRQHKIPSIDELKICFDLDKHANSAIGKWIEFAISKNVRTLELDLGNGSSLCKGNYAFPNKIFDRKCESSLKRSSFNDCVRPCATVMEIKFLKSLILKRVDVNDEGLKIILRNCPVLEHLLVYGSSKLVKVKIHGKGLALKKLEIIYCDGLESIEMWDSNIVSFKSWRFYIVGSPIRLRLDNLQKLEKISVYDSEMEINNMYCQISCNIPCLQSLELIIYRPQKDMQFSPFPKLPKLKQLIIEFGTWDDGSLYVLTSMVEACPNLQTFTIKLFGGLNRLINREVRQAAKKPHEHLEVVEIQGYRGWTFDLELAMYFIENSVALKKLVIEPYILGLATKEKNGARYNIQQQLEPKTPVGVELVIL